MGTPTTFSDYSQSSATLERTGLMLGKGSNRIRMFPFHSISSSVTLRLSPPRRRRERRPALIRFAPSPTSIQFSPFRVSSDASHAVSLKFSWRSDFEHRDCQPSGRFRARRTILSRFAPFV
jgi:hypothetical protein